MPPRKPTTGDVPATPATSKPSTKKPAAAKIVKAAAPAPVAAKAEKPAKAPKKPAAKKAAKPAPAAAPAIAPAVAAVETLTEALAVVSTPELAAVDAPVAAPAAVLAFRADWREDQEGALTAGRAVVLRYEPARLATEPAAEGASPAAEIVGHARFLPGGQLDRTPLRRQADDAAAAVEAELPIPAEAREVELWFEGTDATGATRWDSRFGANYRFGVTDQG